PSAAPTGAAVRAGVGTYSPLARHVAFAARLGGQFWTRRDVPPDPRAIQQVLLDDPPGAGEVVVSLETGDALAVDDEAVTYIAPSQRPHLLPATDSRDPPAPSPALPGPTP